MYTAGLVHMVPLVTVVAMVVVLVTVVVVAAVVVGGTWVHLVVAMVTVLCILHMDPLPCTVDIHRPLAGGTLDMVPLDHHMVVVVVVVEVDHLMVMDHLPLPIHHLVVTMDDINDATNHEHFIKLLFLH